MSEVYTFEEYAGSSRGLLARATLPTDVLATSANINSITYRVKDMTAGGAWSAPAALVVADVMFATPQTWSRQTGKGTGYTFRWAAPGSLWPVAGHKYRIEITFVPEDGNGNALPALAFIEVWEATALSTA